jgi:hypothetical protein
MPEQLKLVSVNDLPCCPEVSKEPCCDRLIFTYRLINRIGNVPVEIQIRALFERCPGPLAIGDIVYSTTLLPGEKVRLFTANRKSRFTFDTESQVSYRHEQTSEESFYMSAMDRFMSDLTVREEGGSQASSSGSFKTDGSVSGAIESFFVGPSVSASGSYNAQSSFDFSRELTRHAEGSHERSVQATRAASSVAVGEVQSRTHAEGESESSFEAATRVIENRNKCHAVTYFAYQLDKRQTVRFKVIAILRRVVDPAGDSKVDVRPPQFNGDVAVIPQGVLATQANRVTVESAGRGSSAADRAGLVSGFGGEASAGLSTASIALLSTRVATLATNFSIAPPISDEVREAALQKVDEDLVSAGLIDKVGGQLSVKAAAELSFERTTCLATTSIVIKGCLDDCNVCEDDLRRDIKLDLERKELENKMLAHQIEHLETSQEYRCCPKGEVEDDA